MAAHRAKRQKTGQRVVVESAWVSDKRRDVHFRTIRNLLIAALGLIFAVWQVQAQAAENEGWSQDLLSRLLTAPASPGAGSVQATQGQGMVMHSYQLRNLKLGDPGRATHVVSIMKRLLPADSSVTEERSANTLHVFTTEAAHGSVVELLVSMDAESVGNNDPSAAMPENVRKAVESLASARPDSDSLLKAIQETQAEGEKRIANSLNEFKQTNRSETLHLFTMLGLGLLAAFVIGGGVVLHYMMRSQKQVQHVVTSAQSAALVPAQQYSSLMLANEEQKAQMDTLGKALETICIQFQGTEQRMSKDVALVTKKHGEVQALMDRIEQLRNEVSLSSAQQFLEINREAVEAIITQASASLHTQMEKVNALALQATQKLDDTANRLEVQQDRLQQVTAELTITQQSCDLLEDKLHKAIERAHQAEQEANQHKEIAAAKSEALAKREAALAGLSMLMQEPMDQILQNVNESLASEDPSVDEAAQSARATEMLTSANESKEEGLPPLAASDSTPESTTITTATSCLTKNNFKILPVA
jgi:hypothetical protein